MNVKVHNIPTDPVNVTLRDTSGNAVGGGVLKGAPTDGSSSVASGGTSQQVFAANSTRSWLFIQNISTTVLYFNFSATAVVDSNSIKLNANSFYENPPHYCPNGTVTIIGATTGQKFVAKQA